jgi:hypothetical protein
MRASSSKNAGTAVRASARQVATAVYSAHSEACPAPRSSGRVTVPEGSRSTDAERPGYLQEVPGGYREGRRQISTRFSSCAFSATITVLADMKIAAMAGASRIP